MNRLIWKEMREMMLPALLLAAVSFGLLLYGSTYTFAGPLDEVDGWELLPGLAAGLLGGSLFASETAGGRAGFLYSRPVGWKRVLGTKLLVGIGYLFAVAVASAVVFIIVTPMPFKHLITAERLLIGIGWAVAFTGAPFLLGAACSLGFPGLFGSVATAAAVIAFASFQLTLQSSLLGTTLFPWSLLGWIAMAAVALVVLARFGITLPSDQRLKRYALLCPLGMLAIPLDYTLRPPLAPTHYAAPPYAYISPDLKYAVDHEGVFGRFNGASITGGSLLETPGLSQWDVNQAREWGPEGRLVLKQDKAVVIAWLDTSDKIQAVRFRSGALYPQLLFSPDRKLLAVKGDGHRAFVVDILQARVIYHVPQHAASLVWWHSNRELGFYADGRLQKVKIETVDDSGGQ